MSVQGAGETERATINRTVTASSGTNNDVVQLQAQEDRRIKEIVVVDSSEADVGAEVSFSSSSTFRANATEDASRAATLHYHEGTYSRSRMDVRWSRGEEIHLHTANGGGTDEDLNVIVYYVEA